MKVCVITEGGAGIGLGHITRCVALCQAFVRLGITPVIAVNCDKNAGGLITYNKKIIFNWLKDKEKLFRLIEGASLVVVDSYLAGAGFYNKISGLAQLGLYFDDYKRIDYPRGIVLNSAIYAGSLGYPRNKDITYLLGAKYAPVRKEFWGNCKKIINRDIRRVVVTLGGADHANLTPEILKLLNKSYPRVIKYVIVGPAFKNMTAVNREKGISDKVIRNLSAVRIRKIMLEADLAISACGQTLYELARMGVPTIGVGTVENQLKNAVDFRNTGFLEYAGYYKDKDIMKKILLSIECQGDFETRMRASRIGKKLIDGKGVQRIARLCIKKAIS